MAKEKKSDLRKKREAIARDNQRQLAASGRMPVADQERILKSDDRNFFRRTLDRITGRSEPPLHSDAEFESFAAKHGNVRPGDSNEPVSVFSEGGDAPNIWDEIDGGRGPREPIKVRQQGVGQRPQRKRESNAGITVEHGELPDSPFDGQFSGTSDESEPVNVKLDRMEGKLDEMPRAVKEELFSE